MVGKQCDMFLRLISSELRLYLIPVNGSKRSTVTKRKDDLTDRGLNFNFYSLHIFQGENEGDKKTSKLSNAQAASKENSSEEKEEKVEKNGKGKKQDHEEEKEGKEKEEMKD